MKNTYLKVLLFHGGGSQYSSYASWTKVLPGTFRVLDLGGQRVVPFEAENEGPVEIFLGTTMSVALEGDYTVRKE